MDAGQAAQGISQAQYAELLNLLNLALARGAGALTRSSFKLPVDFYINADTAPNRRFYFLDDLPGPAGFTSMYIGTEAEAPAGGNYLFAVAHDNSEIAIAAAIGEVVIVPPTFHEAFVIVAGAIFQTGGASFISGDGQPWVQAVAGDFSIAGAGPLVVDATTAQSPTLRFTGVLGASTTLEFPNHVGATWDCDFSDANLGADTLTCFCGGNVVNVPLSGNILGVRLQCTKSGYLIAMGAPST